MIAKEIVPVLTELKTISPQWASRIEKYGLKEVADEYYRDITTMSCCVVGEAWGFSDVYWSGEKGCDQCDKAAFYVLNRKGGLSLKGLKKFIRHFKSAHQTKEKSA